MIKIGFDKQWALLRKFQKELPERFHKTAQYLTRTGAESIRDGVVGRLPGGAAYTDYKKSIKILEVGTGEQQSAHAVMLRLKGKDSKQSTKAQSVVYVRAARTMRPVSRDILLLEQNGPWTLETLPFKPRPSQATLVSKTVGAREYQLVQKRNRRDSLKLRSQFARAGHRIVRSKNAVLKTKRSVAQPVMDALALEFGNGTSDHKPAWKPALLEFARSTLPNMQRSDSQLRKALSDPNFGGWQQWPKKSDGSVSANDLQSTKSFVKRLGLRF